MKLGLAVLMLLAACSSGQRGTQSPPSDLYVRNIVLASSVVPSARIGFRASGPAADVIVSYAPTNARVRLCALLSVDAMLPAIDSCKDAASGVRESVTVAGTIGGIAILTERAPVVRASLFIEFDEGSRDVSLRLPMIETGGPACQDRDCNPFVELTPLHNGRFRARATWTEGNASLLLLQGSVLGRSALATGVPYREAARSEGASPRLIEAEMSTPGEYALVIRQDPGAGARGLRDVRVDAHWP